MSKKTVLKLPKHGKPKPNRTASAPYNFIPLPETVVTAVDNVSLLPDHNQFEQRLHTGHFDVTLTTKSPLYIRCPLTIEQFFKGLEDGERLLPYKEQVKNIPDFFYTQEIEQPVIPGSSLRGMLRNVLEIVSYSKIQWVTDEELQLGKKKFKNTPLDNVPLELRRPEDVDYAEAIFGFARQDGELQSMVGRGIIKKKPKQGEKGHAYASRVSITNAHLSEGQRDTWWLNETITPEILASPKPTAFQHYLVQPDSDKDKLRNYDNKTPEETVVRGFKRYWLQGERNKSDIKVKEEDKVDPNSTQHTRFNAVKPGVKFKFRLYFENLSDEELGALCWILHPQGDPDKEYCHQLGMGKPLGMGAAKLDARLYITDRIRRYASLFDGNSWETGADGSGQYLTSKEVLDEYTLKFEKHILDALGHPSNRLLGVERVLMLLKMMEWPGYPVEPGGNLFLKKEKRPNTRYMAIEPDNEYRERPILPTPADFDTLTIDKKHCSGSSKEMPDVGASGRDVENIVKTLKGKGEVSRFPEIIITIGKILDSEERCEAAKLAKKWLVDNNLWEKEPHASMDWRKKISEWLELSRDDPQ